MGHDPRPPERDYPRLLRFLARDRHVDFHGTAADADLAVTGTIQHWRRTDTRFVVINPNPVSVAENLQHLGIDPQLGFMNVAARFEDADDVPLPVADLDLGAHFEIGELPRRAATRGR